MNCIRDDGGVSENHDAYLFSFQKSQFVKIDLMTGFVVRSHFIIW